MVTVEFLGPIAIEPRELEVYTLQEVACELQKDPLVAPWLSQCSIAINGVLTANIEAPLCKGDRISLLPPVCGG